ncbi:hypothetical protein H072_3648 [Dactylellina haptotyla CBS 200.50]|uniref:BTB domain-containing protein n=1 Tax=Dactylellina haptotyla (strain CBS 200.50) TaxID=1284197 RepID=S8AMU1_DACHA|nr:hypothetical protein H072_3648 [Dactylellina haptotyla CBS 200.50]
MQNTTATEIPTTSSAEEAEPVPQGAEEHQNEQPLLPPIDIDPSAFESLTMPTSAGNSSSGSESSSVTPTSSTTPTSMSNSTSALVLLNAQVPDVNDLITRHRADSIHSAASTIYLNSRSAPHRPSLEDAFGSRASSVSASRPATPTARKLSMCEDLFSTPPTLRKPASRALVPAPSAHPDFQTCESVSIVPNADVALLVGQPNSPDRRKVLASSHILTIASSYFRALLAPDRFSEGIVFQQHKNIELQMFEDDPSAVITVCNILHLQSRRIPPSLSGDQLAEVAIILDKYDCVDAAWAWTRLWMSGDTAKIELEEDGGRGSDGSSGNAINLMITKEKDLLSKWLFIAWAFKDTLVFEMCANALSWKLCEGDQEEDEFFQRLPESLQRDLIHTRRSCISSLYDCTQGFIDKFVDPVCDVGIQSFYYRKQSPRDCDSRVLGTTLKGLREAELYPLVKIAKWDRTAAELLGDLRAVGRSIFGADEHHHDITPEMIFLEALDCAREGMRKFKMESYTR